MLIAEAGAGLALHARYALNECKLVFTFRGALVLIALGPAVLVAVQFVLWDSIYSVRDELAGLTLQNTMTYIVFARLWAFVVPGFALASTFERRVRDGSVAQDLLRPGSLVAAWLSRAVGRSAAWFVLMAPIGLVAGLLLRPGLSAWDVVAVVAYATAGYLIAFSFAAGVAVCALLLRRVEGLNEMRDAVVAVLGGAIIPLDFYPEQFREVLLLLPFRFIYYEPMMVLAGLRGASASELLVALLWAGCLLTAVIAALDRSRRRLVIDGGWTHDDPSRGASFADARSS